MSLTPAVLQNLYRRAQLAAARGYTVARGDHYAKALGGSDGSPRGLVALCAKALAGGSEAPAADDTRPTMPPAKAAEPEEGDDYEAWTKAELVEEAKDRGIEVKSSMNKPDVIDALRAADE